MRFAVGLCSFVTAVGLASTAARFSLHAGSNLEPDGTTGRVRSAGRWSAPVARGAGETRRPTFDAAAAARALEALTATTNEAQLLALWRGVLKTNGGPDALTEALPARGFPAWTAAAGLRVIREERLVEPDLVLALAHGAGLAEESQNLTEADLMKLVAQAGRGDPARGEYVYRRKDMGCMVCHALGGAGGKVGPDLTRLGVSTNLHHIVESVLIPNKQIKEGYHSVVIATKDGADLSGVLAGENARELILRDANNQEVLILKSDIESQRIGGSLMPVGVVDILHRTERLDLFRFLSELGKPGPFDASKTNVARVWHVNSDVSASDVKVLNADLRGRQWVPIYSTVNGILLREDLLAELGSVHRREPFYAAASFRTIEAGRRKLSLNGLRTAQAWIDGKAVPGSGEFRVRLEAGRHVFLLKLDPGHLPEGIRIEVSEGFFLAE